MEVLEQHVNAPLPRLSQNLAHHEPLLARMLAKERAERPADALEVMHAIGTARAADAVHSSAA
jgi:hypothetical protein